MDKMTRNAVRLLISARKEIAFKRTENDLEYQKVCRQQEASEEKVEELYQQFGEDERRTIRRHYEGEIHKTNFEITEVYVQGLRDCFGFISFLIGSEIQI